MGRGEEEDVRLSAQKRIPYFAASRSQRRSEQKMRKNKRTKKNGNDELSS